MKTYYEWRNNNKTQEEVEDIKKQGCIKKEYNGKKYTIKIDEWYEWNDGYKNIFCILNEMPIQQKRFHEYMIQHKV